MGSNSDADHLHADRVADALASNDIERLRRLAIHGFVSNTYRRRIWPLLLGLDADDVSSACESLPVELAHDRSLAPPHAHLDTVEKDIARSLCNYDICQGWDPQRLDKERRKLSWIINRIMTMYSDHLYYIQGYHDLCSVFLIVSEYDHRLALVLCERASQFHLREILRPDLGVVIEVLKMLFPLLYEVDRELAAFLIRSNAESYFALSWVLTWFSHTFYHFQDVARVFDFLLASHLCMPLYIAAAFIVMHRDGVLQVECDMPMIHQYFQGQTTTDLAVLLPLAADLFDQYPPYSLFRRCRPKFPVDSVLPMDDLSAIYHQQERSPISPSASGFHQFPSQLQLNLIPLILVVVLGIVLWRLALVLARL